MEQYEQPTHQPMRYSLHRWTGRSNSKGRDGNRKRRINCDRRKARKTKENR